MNIFFLYKKLFMANLYGLVNILGISFFEIFASVVMLFLGLVTNVLK